MQRSSASGQVDSIFELSTKMGRHNFLPKIMLLFLIILSSILSFSQAITDEGNLKTYIVLVKEPEGLQYEDLDSWYESFLPVRSSSSKQQRMVFSYRNVVTGFAAKLTPEEAKAMEVKDGFVSARLDQVLSLHTTHTPNFLGLNPGVGFWNSSNYGMGVIIGLLDTGIAPELPSFDGTNMPPPPAKWKGKCEFNGTACNNKLIGARSFVSSETSPEDGFGHGTHTASTAAGSPVPGANYYGMANGTAVGIAPLAHLAMYKVCGSSGGCSESAILAGMDAAVGDGVDILSLSLGGPSLPFYEDIIALGAYGAIQKGIFVSCSAGNSGPGSSSLSNEAPWILTVGASTVDREIRSTVLLGNNSEILGQSMYQPKDYRSTMLPLVYAGANGSESAAWCSPGSLSNADIKGKIVLCLRGGGIPRIDKGQEVKDNGGAGMILMNDKIVGNVTEADLHVLPASHVSYDAGLAILDYINSTSSPTAEIVFKGTVIGVPYAPQVALFSSRGPSWSSPGILKPDIIGPGVNILAAWPDSYDNSDNPLSKFIMISGTSMSCPHLSGTAALLKISHPNWSPAAIKSAIMTTAYLTNLGGMPITDQEFSPATVFDIGAGHVNPPSANDPGLVYDLQPDDYIPYLCGLNYSDEDVSLIVKHTVNCSSVASIPEAQLNYPSFAIELGSTPLTYTRTVTNVGQPNSVYTPQVVGLTDVSMQVTPGNISFSQLNEKATYSVTFSKSGSPGGTFTQGYLTWVSGHYNVRSPIAVTFK